MFIVFITEIQHIQAIGDHGQIVQQHVVKEFKHDQERARMMLKTLADHSLSKKLVAYLQLIGGHGQAVLQPVIMASKQEQEHVLTIKEVPRMSQKLTKKLVKSKNAVMTLGPHGVVMIHVPIVVLVHINDNAHDKSLSKFQRVHKKENRFNTIIRHKIVVIQAIGVPVSSRIQ